MTSLAAHYRGDTFSYSFTLGNGWVGSDFTGGVKFTLRRTEASSSTVTDSDAVDQASVATGEITFSGATGTIVIPASRTNAWPAKRLLWDLQGVVDLATDRVETIDSGDILIKADVTRSQ